jgi:hypothetical protein
MSFCLLILPPLVLNLFPFPLAPAQLLGNRLPIKRCAANMTLALIITHQYNGVPNPVAPILSTLDNKRSPFLLTGEVLKPEGYIDHRRTLPAPPSPPQQHQEQRASVDVSEGGHDTDPALEVEAAGELSESDRSRQVFISKNVRYASVADPGCLSRIPEI